MPRAGKRQAPTAFETALFSKTQLFLQAENRIGSSVAHAEQPQFPQPLLIRLVFQILHQLRCPSLDTLQHLNVLLVVRGPKLNTVFEAEKLGLFSLEKRRLWGDLVVAFQYLKGAYKKDGDRLFSRACSNRTRGNGFKLKEGRFRLDRRRKFFTMRVMKHWHRLPGEVVDAPSLETFQIGREEMASSCTRGALEWILGNFTSLKGLSRLPREVVESPSLEVFKSRLDEVLRDMV
ncbi:hypothetical protein QYF61_024248 [Mycteria americana]|uniref:Uncharacterized protein n=1 Tax=Mycteria americana TaxID=33587 RepID=A0AAN7PB41_MYCAM|nr:hypothetical protein QYF61_024248 [Mycteria americana]